MQMQNDFVQHPRSPATSDKVQGLDNGRTTAVITGAFLALTAFYALVMWRVLGVAGFPLDDAFIHLQFARNLFETGQMAFNPGIPSTGSTAPGFCVVIVALYAIVRDWYAASYLAGALPALACGWLCAAILRQWTGREDAARFGGVLALVMSPMVVLAYSGMEAPLYCAVFLLGLWVYGFGTRGARILASGIFGLALWSRPEMFLMAPAVALERLRGARLDRTRGVWGELVQHALVWLVMGGLYVFYHWRIDGHFVPTTFSAKAIHFDTVPEWAGGVAAAFVHRRWDYVLASVTVWPVALLLTVVIGLLLQSAPVLFAACRAVRGAWNGTSSTATGSTARRLALITLVLYPLARGAVSPWAIYMIGFHRYFAHLGCLAVLLAVDFGYRRSALATSPRRRRTWLLAALPYTVFTVLLAIGSVGNIQTMHFGMARWVQANTEPDALIAANDIGVLAFLTRRRVLDVVGLVEPGILAHRRAGGTTLSYVDARRPEVAIVFPGWFPDIAASAEYERVFSIRVDPNFVCGGPELIAYRRKGDGRRGELGLTSAQGKAPAEEGAR